MHIGHARIHKLTSRWSVSARASEVVAAPEVEVEAGEETTVGATQEVNGRNHESISPASSWLHFQTA